jgi:vitamin B12 transporter
MFPRFTLTAAAVATLFSCAAQATEVDEAVIVVTATRQATRHSELLSDVATIEREEIEHSGQTSVAQLLSRKAGIHVVSSGGPGSNTSVFIRGANSGHTLVLIDGMRYGSATTGQAALENIPLSAVERIEILRGPASSLYGSDAIGGVIQIFTRNADANGIELFAGTGSHNTTEFTAGLTAGNETFRINLQGGHIDTDAFDSLKNPPDKDGFKQDNGSGNLSVALPNKGQLNVTFLLANGKNKIDVGTPLDSYIDKEASAVGSSWQQPINDVWKSALSANETIDDQASHDTGNDSVIRTKRRQLAWQNDFRLASGKYLLGAERTDEYVGNSVTNYANTARSIDSFLAGWTGNWANNRLQANARQDRNAQFGNKNTGAIAYGYQFTSELRAHLSAGTGFKAPTFNDLYFPLMCFPPFGCFGGNAALKPEQSRNTEIGVNWEGPGRNVAIVAYRNKVKDLIVWGNQPFNIGEATLKGASLSYNETLGNSHLGAEVSLLDAIDGQTGERLIRRPRRTATFSASHKLGAWTFGEEVVAVSNRADTDFTTGNRVRLAGYALINAYAHLNLSQNWKIEMRGNNLGNRHYAPAFDFESDGRNVFVGIRYLTR